MEMTTKKKTSGRYKSYVHHLLIIDGSNLAHRCYVKFDKFYDYKKRRIGLIYGFMKVIQQYIVRFRPTYVLVTFDTQESKSSNFRKELLGSYKIHRKVNLKFDYEDFNSQLETVYKILLGLKIPIILDREGLGHESDDYIGYYALRHAEKGGRVTIISSDKDFCQLIGPRIKVFNPAKSDLIMNKNCSKIMGYSPDECVDYLCLVGDKSDDIPGYTGIGDVKARQFLDKFGSIKAFLRDKNAEFKGIDRDGLKDLYKRNRRLIDIRVALKKYPLTKIPILYNEEDWIRRTELTKIFKKHKFRSMYSVHFFKTFKVLKQYEFEKH